MRKAVVAVLVAAAAIVIASVIFVRWPGDAGSYGNGLSAPLRVGGVLDAGTMRIENHGGGPLWVDDTRLHRPDGLTLVGALVTSGNAAIGSANGWPPPTKAKLVQARGYRIPVRSDVDLVVGFRATQPGTWSVEGVDVLYHRRILGVTLKLRDHIGEWIGVCARATKGQPRCTPPDPLR
jgi:hypothetical protein